MLSPETSIKASEEHAKCVRLISSAKSNAERMEIVSRPYSKLIDAKYDLEVRPKKSFKDTAKSLYYRVTGNTAFCNKEYMTARNLYSSSVAYAPNNSEELSLAFANRSAVLLRMGKYQDCITDIQLAIENGYPETLMHKIILREALCCRNLNKMDQADEKFDAALKALEQAELTEDECQALKKHISLQKTQPPSKVVDLYPVCLALDPPELSYGPSEEAPCLSSGVRIGYNQTFGRHLVATRDITAGDILIVEDAYGAVLSPETRFKFCSHCKNPCFSLIPCTQCPMVMFCSKLCQQTALEEYHLVECPILARYDLMFAEKVPSLAVAIRCIAKTGINNIPKYFDIPVKVLNTDEDRRTLGFNNNNQYDSTDFQTFCSLISHVVMPFPKDHGNALVAYCTATLKLAKCIDPDHKNCPQYLGLLLRLVTTWQLYHVNVSGTNVTCPDLDWSSAQPTNYLLASSMMALNCLLSHSCLPNVRLLPFGNTVASIAIDFIPKGTQLVVSYCESFMTSPKEIRQLYLKTGFGFDCHCEACDNNWPLLEQLPLLTRSQIESLPQPYYELLVLFGDVPKVKNVLGHFLTDRSAMNKYLLDSLPMYAKVIKKMKLHNLHVSDQYMSVFVEIVQISTSLPTLVTNYF